MRDCSTPQVTESGGVEPRHAITPSLVADYTSAHA